PAAQIEDLRVDLGRARAGLAESVPPSAGVFELFGELANLGVLVLGDHLGRARRWPELSPAEVEDHAVGPAQIDDRRERLRAGLVGDQDPTSRLVDRERDVTSVAVALDERPVELR